MSRFNFTDKLNFDEVDLTPPNRIVGTIGLEFAEATRGIIKLGIESYEGQITQQKPSFATSIAGIFQMASAQQSILPEMGKLGEEVHQYEIYLYTPSYAGYKFRLMFIRYGVASYPAEIILEQGTANAFAEFAASRSDPIIQVSSRRELEYLLENILSTQYILDVMQELIRVDQMQRQKKKEAALRMRERELGIRADSHGGPK